jgi:hypothetical protein
MALREPDFGWIKAIRLSEPKEVRWDKLPRDRRKVNALSNRQRCYGIVTAFISRCDTLSPPDLLFVALYQFRTVLFVSENNRHETLDRTNSPVLMSLSTMLHLWMVVSRLYKLP